MDSEVLLLEKQGHVRVLTLNRPEKRNSLSVELLLKLADTVQELGKDDDARALVIRGAGGKAFCAGFDLGALLKESSSKMGNMWEDNNPFDMAMESVANYPYPVIAMVNGYAFGGGCDLAVSCDIRIAVEDARMGMVPAKIGVVYSPPGLKRFLRAIGYSNTKELFFTGRTFQAFQLKEMGMLNYILPREEIEDFTYEMAEEIAGNSPLSLKGTKKILKLIGYSGRMTEDDLAEAKQIILESYKSEDVKEGRLAFFEKRKPIFQGK